MANRFVNVVISRQTQVVSAQGFGMPLILSTDKDFAYKEYSGSTALAQIGADFTEASNTYKLATRLLGQNPKIQTLAILGKLYNDATGNPATLTDALNTLLTTKRENEFYYLTSTTQDPEAIVALSAWTDAQIKLYFVSTSDVTLLDSLSGERTVVLAHNVANEYPAEAWVGVGAPKPIGSFTWTFKTLSGINPATYDTTAINNIHTGNGNTYIREGGVDITSNGVTASGEYIDIIQGSDFISARMTENVFGLLVREDKVPYTTAGIGMIVAAMEESLRQAATQGIIATDEDGNPIYNVDIPEISEISANDKAARRLPAIQWSATVAGAIEDVDINGSLEV